MSNSDDRIAFDRMRLVLKDKPTCNQLNMEAACRMTLPKLLAQHARFQAALEYIASAGFTKLTKPKMIKAAHRALRGTE